MKLFTRTNCIGALGLVVATAAGCATATPSEGSPAPAVREGLELPPVAGSAAGHEATEERREAFGPLALVGEALSKIGLSDEQRAAAEKLGKKVREKEEKVVQARNAFSAALADQLESDEIDEDALEDEIDALVEAREEASPVLRSAMKELHGLLDKEQRAEFVDVIEKRMGAHTDDSEKWVDELAKDLNLSDAQKTRVADVLERAEPRVENERATAIAIFKAFKEDEFSMEDIVPVDEVGARTRSRAEAMVATAQELAEILTPEQTVALAQRIAPRKGGAAVQEVPGAIDQAITIRRGYRTGAVRSWGSGYGMRRTRVSSGYSAGYPLTGGYGPDVW